jgi:hypothetical protein
MVERGEAGLVRVWLARRGEAWRGWVRPGTARQGALWHVLAGKAKYDGAI